MTSTTVFRVLREPLLSVDDVPVVVGGTRQQAVLATLLLAHPQGASFDQVRDAVWGDRPPDSWRGTVQAYVSRLRALLRPLGCDVSSVPRGYRIDLGEAAYDVDEFTAQLAVGTEAAGAGRHGQAIRCLEAALTAWQAHDDAPLPEAAGVVSAESATWSTLEDLHERYRAAHRLLARQYLAAGDSEHARHLLIRSLVESPYDEQVAADLLTALYRLGQTADALEEYGRFRQRLRRELGLDPSDHLREVHRAILRGERSLEWQPPRVLRQEVMLPTRNLRFHGRDDLLHRVEELLAAHPVVVLHGLAGTGKSDVAREVAHRHDGLAVWLPAEDRAVLLNALVDLASLLGVDVGREARLVLSDMWDALEQHPGWLMVIDGAPDPDTVDVVLAGAGSGRLLLTSPNGAWARVAETLEVGPFDEAEATAFVTRRSGDRDRGAAAVLAHKLGYLPLALEQAAAYVEQTGMTLQEYVHHFRTRHDLLLTKGAPSGHRTHVAASWRLLFDHVREESERAATLLEVCAFLATDGVPRPMLVALCDGDELGLAEALAPLLRFSLVDRDAERLRAHRLVQTVVRSDLAPARRAARLAEAARMLRAYVSGEPSDPASWPAWSQASVQVAALITCVDQDDDCETLVPLALGCARYSRARGALQLAGDLLDRMLDLVGSSPGRALSRAELLTERGDVHDAAGDARRARDALEGALLSVRNRGPTSRPDEAVLTARARVRLAHALNCAGEHSEAEELYRAGIRVLRQGGGVGELAQGLIGLGYTSWSRADYAGAESAHREAQSVLEAAGWRDHPMTAEAMSGLGMMLHEQGRVAEALSVQTAALALARRLHGPSTDHVQVAEILDKMGYELGLLQRWPEARERHLESVAILCRLFGEADTRYATALANLGRARVGCGERARGEADQRRGLRLLVAAYGPEHPTAKVIAARLTAAEVTESR